VASVRARRKDETLTSWLGQCCINVTDLDRSVAFYELFGLSATSRTEIPDAFEAIVENLDGKGGKLQLARQKKGVAPLDHGNAFWKQYVNTNDIGKMYSAVMDAGFESVAEPERYERWPVTVAFVRDPDGYLVEIVQRHPWGDDGDQTQAWIGQHCLYVRDIAGTRAFYEVLGLTCTSETDIPAHREVILEGSEGKGGKLQLAQKLDDDSPVVMGTAMWKQYVNTDDCVALHGVAVDAGYHEIMAPMRLERWPTTISFLADPDGYQVELVQRHAS